MDEIIKVNSENPDCLTVSGRELHSALEVNSNYTTWFNRMCDYGFTENIDYKTCFPNLETENHGGQNKVDHQITIDMAKELCMLQRTEKGKEFRQYFIECEKAWNSPEMVMSRALQIAQSNVERLKNVNIQLEQKIEEYRPKVEYHDNVINTGNTIPTTNIAKDLGMTSAQVLNKILVKNKIIFPKKNKDGKIKGYEVTANYSWLITEKYADYVIFQKKNSIPSLRFTEKGRQWIVRNIGEWDK